MCFYNFCVTGICSGIYCWKLIVSDNCTASHWSGRCAGQRSQSSVRTVNGQNIRVLQAHTRFKVNCSRQCPRRSTCIAVLPKYKKHLISVTAESLFKKLDELFQSIALPLTNLVSIVMDSCCHERLQKWPGDHNRRPPCPTDAWNWWWLLPPYP